jgi:hypothetical protein
VAAVRALGPRLDAVASRLGWSTDQLRDELLSDAALHWDGANCLYYAEPVAPVVASASGVASPLSAAVASVSSAATPGSPFQLHSQPGATKVLYLDFDGSTTTGTSWNNGFVDPMISAPYDVNGDSAVLTDLERERIGHIWMRVADDFAPFDHCTTLRS